MEKNLYTSIITVLILLFLIIPIVLCGRFCQWSKETAVAVSSCPQNMIAMEEKAKMKNCETMAKIQNCTVPEKFKYHCVMNELQTIFVEVCAPEYYIHGHCAEYNSLGAVIQEHFSLKCSDVKPPCNTSYLSSDAYLYKGCYDRVILISSTESISTEFPNGIRSPFLSNNESNGNTYLFIIIPFVGLFSAIALTCLLIKLKQRIDKPSKSVMKTVNRDEEQFISDTEEKPSDIESRT